MTSNPIADEKGDELKKEILILYGDYFGGLSRLNKDEITSEDRADAVAEKEVRRVQKEEADLEERTRLEAEEAERAA